MKTDAKKFPGTAYRQNLYTQFFQNNRNSLNCRKRSMYLLREENPLFFITENKLENKNRGLLLFIFYSMCFLLGKYIQATFKEFEVETNKDKLNMHEKLLCP